MRIASRCRAMFRARSTRLGIFSLCLAAVVLTACGGGNDESATATPAIPTLPPAPTATIGPSTPGNFANSQTELGGIVWATGVDETTKAPLDQVDSYNHDAPAIYAVLPVVRLSPNTQFSAEWDLDGTPMPKLTTTINGSDLPEGGWLEFHLLRTTNLFWPVGSYHVRILVDGQLAQEATVQVKSPNQ